MKITTTAGKYFLSQDLERIKAAKRMDGISVESIQGFILNTFECAMKLFDGQSVNVTYYTDDKVLYSEFSETLEFAINDNEYVVNGFGIDKWKISDILFDMDDFENCLKLLLIDGGEVILNLGDFDCDLINKQYAEFYADAEAVKEFYSAPYPVI